MTITPATEQDAEFGGVDSHADTIHVAVVTDRGGHVADAEFLTTASGYAAAIAFLNAHGTVTAVGIEGTSSYDLRFTRAARQAGLTVVEVNRPDKAERRRIGKSDPIDAYAVARAALSGRASVIPKDDTISGIRALHNAARSTVKARTATLNQISISCTSPRLHRRAGGSNRVKEASRAWGVTVKALASWRSLRTARRRSSSSLDSGR